MSANLEHPVCYQASMGCFSLSCPVGLLDPNEKMHGRGVFASVPCSGQREGHLPLIRLRYSHPLSGYLPESSVLSAHLRGVSSPLSRYAVGWFQPVGNGGHRDLRHTLAPSSSPARTLPRLPFYDGVGLPIEFSNILASHRWRASPHLHPAGGLVPGGGIEPPKNHSGYFFACRGA